MTEILTRSRLSVDRRLVLPRLDLYAQGDVVAHHRDESLHAEIRTFQAACHLGTAIIFFIQRMGTAFNLRNRR